ncbi:ATP-grasp domain-containing protein [Kribbella catacumbae]|uniref:ATP-grasp domain-containing protein n=1 Tax=Kribbella catacumbae TaxID=460086 RepID=UPI00039C828D|nr:hypothetical protein [Kribbella catacumbae]
MAHSVVIVEGRRHGAASIVPAVIARLERQGISARIHTADDGRRLSGPLTDADVVGLRHLSTWQLAALGQRQAGPVRFCNSVASTAAVRDKELACSLLAAAGLPLPLTMTARTWAEVRSFAGSAIVVKSTEGSGGRDVLLLPDGRPPAIAPFPGPYLVQEFVSGNGVDYKLYVVGSRVAGVLRRWPAMALQDKLGTPFAPSAEQRQIALVVGEALGLELFGVDILMETGPVVVDVNAFPGFKGVTSAPAWIADYLATLARGR